VRHTHGPWLTNGFVSPVDGAITVYNKPFGQGDVAKVYKPEDAFLIAASPELLEKLEALLAMVRCNIKGALLEVAMSDAETVINKARGES
jgi:hypothetical protein